MAGKPNQTIPPAPLYPIPVVCEPFERVLVDCVGPLPRTKGGNKFLVALTKFFFVVWHAESCTDRSGFKFHVACVCSGVKAAEH